MCYVFVCVCFSHKITEISVSILQNKKFTSLKKRHTRKSKHTHIHTRTHAPNENEKLKGCSEKCLTKKKTNFHYLYYLQTKKFLKKKRNSQNRFTRWLLYLFIIINTRIVT